MLRYDRQTKPGLVALYDIRPGNGAGPFLQPWSPHGAYNVLMGKLNPTHSLTHCSRHTTHLLLQFCLTHMSVCLPNYVHHTCTIQNRLNIYNVIMLVIIMIIYAFI